MFIILTEKTNCGLVRSLLQFSKKHWLQIFAIPSKHFAAYVLFFIELLNCSKQSAMTRIEKNVELVYVSLYFSSVVENESIL